MKLKTIPLATLVAFTLAGSASAATLLFSDNFTATGPGTPNDQISNVGRQGGTLATLGYLQSGNVQIGNATNAAPHGGNDMLVAFGGRAYVNYDFSSQTVPLEISFKGLVNSANVGTADQWVSFSVGNNTTPFVNGPNVSSVLFRANGETQLFDNAADSTGGSGLNTGLDAWVDYKIVLSDTAGTGGAWGTGGSRITYFSNNTQLGTFDIGQLVSGEGYFGFAAANISGYDNLTITAIPEPAAAIPEPAAALLGSLGLLALLRRSRA
jgi:hypothetical protein